MYRDISNVVNMTALFQDAQAFTVNVSTWDISKVQDISFMFAAKNSISDIRHWDVSSVITMRAVFQGSDFNQDISLWNVTSLQNADYAFFRALDFNQNLCPWGDILAGRGNDTLSFFNAFGFSNCNTDESPDFSLDRPGPFCHAC